MTVTECSFFREFRNKSVIFKTKKNSVTVQASKIKNDVALKY